MIEPLNEPAPENPVNLNAMTKAELLSYAQKNGIPGVSGSMLKAEILDVVRGE